MIANYLFLEEAKRAEHTAGEPLPGVGCLGLMWAATGLLALLFFGFWAWVFGVSILR